MKKNSIKKSVRLPSHIYPVRYKLDLKPDLESFTFSGKEIVDIVINKNTNEITLHSKDIDIKTAEIIQGKETQFSYKISYNEKSETVTIKFKNKIKEGRAKLVIVFEGIINENLRGFYRSRYTINGETKHLATTQFEATDARRAFPCFDEPAHKAIFDVSLIIPGHHTAISNTLPKSIVEHEAGYKVVEFASTPRMSTYLLAFIIGEFEYIEGTAKPVRKISASGEPTRGPEILRTGEATKVRIFTTKGKKHQAKFALDVAIKSLEFYNKYFDIPYPLPVLDLIAIPDFESAAMENWGAITFRESALLVDEDHSSLSNKQWVAIVIAHEIAHQWFGNLVTMEWWTDLWLNEGFASYMENYCIDNIFPEWHIWDLYLSDRYQVALKLDALANSHPIEVDVHHPDEISEIFDMVSYAKGSAVIRMLALYIGSDNFRDGLRHYLKKHSYKNTITSDLWVSFEKVSHMKVKKMMDIWTKKVGYPLVILKENKGSYELCQERFFLSRISRKQLSSSNHRTIWPIPLKYELDNKINNLLLSSKVDKIKGSKTGKVNIDEGSFTRVMYDKQTLNLLKGKIEKRELQVADRLGIVRDLFALAEGGYINSVDALEFALSYKNENEYTVWTEIAGGIGKINSIIVSESLPAKYINKYKTYTLELFSPLAHRMGWEKRKDEKHEDTFLRSLAISQAGYYGDINIINKAKKLFSERNTKPIPPDIRNAVYSIVAQNGDGREWNQFKKMYLGENLHEEKERFSNALSKFKNVKLLKDTLSFALSSDVRTQDAPSLIGSVWSNPVGRDLTWKFIKSKWPEILKRYGEGGHFLSRLLSPLGGHNKKTDAEDAKKFFKNNSAPGADRTLLQIYERIYSNASWQSADKSKIIHWLESRY